MTLPSIVPILAVLVFPAGQREIEEPVARFWTALEKGDKVTAMKFVHPDDLNVFLNRMTPLFSAWELVSIEIRGDGTAVSKVRTQRTLPTGTFQVTVLDRWQRIREGWRVRVVSSEEQIRRSLGPSVKKPFPPSLDIFPRILKFYKVAPQQGASIIIRNGLDSIVRLESVQFDERLFVVDELPVYVRPQGVGTAYFRYIGEPTVERLDGTVTLRFEVDGKWSTYEIPLIYNYTDESLEWVEKKARRNATVPKPPGR